MTTVTTVTLTDANRATEAGYWCNENLKDSQWNLILTNLFRVNMSYDFTFTNPKQATLFALKWL